MFSFWLFCLRHHIDEAILIGNTLLLFCIIKERQSFITTQHITTTTTSHSHKILLRERSCSLSLLSGFLLLLLRRWFMVLPVLLPLFTHNNRVFFTSSVRKSSNNAFATCHSNDTHLRRSGLFPVGTLFTPTSMSVRVSSSQSRFRSFVLVDPLIHTSDVRKRSFPRSCVVSQIRHSVP